MRAAPCHPDKLHYAKELCRNCYKKTQKRKSRSVRPVVAAVPTCHPDRKHEAKGLCRQCYTKQSGYKDPMGSARRSRLWREANPDHASKTVRIYRHGELAYHAFLTTNTCDACGADIAGKDKHIDHDHHPGLDQDEAFRGILCHRCNVALGLVGDSAARLRALADYIDTAI